MATTPRTPIKSHDEREDARDERRSVTRDEAPPAPDQGLPPSGPPVGSDPIAPTAENPYPTIAEEQRARSRDIALTGVEDWKDAHDERTEEEKAGKQVPGVAPPAPEHASTEAGSWQGSTRTTQAARHAQNPAAPR